jgi:hypothetical protein
MTLEKPYLNLLFKRGNIKTQNSLNEIPGFFANFPFIIFYGSIQIFLLVLLMEAAPHLF